MPVHMTLEFDGIQFGYDQRPLLGGIYMKCAVGKVTGLLGRNGSGKSTLLKIVFGVIRTEILSVRINQQPVLYPAFRSRQIAYLPQESFIPASLPLKKVLKLFQISEESVLHDFTELQQDISLCADELSGGRLRLFEVLLILHSKASFCLLDEPFTGLAPAIVERLHPVIQKAKQQKGILITDHLYKQVMLMADDLYVLRDGKTYPVKDRNDLITKGYLLDQE